MALEIRKIEGRAQIREFANFTETLYGDNEYYVPSLKFDEIDTLDPARNPASEFCESELYMAYRDGVPVGRVAAIVNRRANEQWNHDEVRFGWFDFVDDPEVSSALLGKVEEFGRARGMKSMVGPLGFTDFDPEGMLIDGYDCLSTMALIYNHPYYPKHLEAMGFEKDADWIEYKVMVPEKLPERMGRLAAIVENRFKLHLKPLTRKIMRRENYSRKLFNLINECYKDLYNYTVMPDRMADKYIGFYLTLLDLNFISVVENEKNEIVSFGITMPSLARALQKCRGRLFPFGWWELFKALFLKRTEGVEMLLVGVRPDYQNSGANSLLFYDLVNKYIKAGFKWAETNAILETNIKNQGMWKDFELECRKRRRSYIKHL